MENTNLDTWEYWKEKFKGMSEEQIKAYWVKEMEFAEDPILGIDSGDDGEERAKSVMEAYKKYIAAKKKHDEQIRNEKDDGERI